MLSMLSGVRRSALKSKRWRSYRREDRLPDFSVHKANELGADERQLFERWLGRSLDADETISINAWRPHTAAVGDRRDSLRRDILAQARQIASRAPDMSADETDSLIEEARAAVRTRR